MAEQKQSFRFRLPWLSSQRTTAQPQRPRPTIETSRAPSQPTTSVPIQRPAGKLPSQRPPRKSRPPAKAEPESPPPSPSNMVIVSTKTSPPDTAAKPPSPSPEDIESLKITPQLTSPAGATTKPPSPLTSPPSSPTTKPQSPSRATSESPKADSQPSSPSATTAKQVSPSSVAIESQEDTSQSAFPPPSATITPPSPSQPQPPSHLASQKTTSEVSPSRKADQQEPEPLTGIVTRSPSSPYKSQTIDEDISSASLASTRREATDEPVSPTAIDQKSLVEAKIESKETEGRRETTQEILKHEKMDKATKEEESMQKTVVEVPDTRRDTKETHDIALEVPRRQQTQDALERKETIATTSPIGQQIETVIPSQPTKGTTSISFQKPFLFTEEEEAPRQREIKEGISKLVCSLTTGLWSAEKPVTIITLTGENRGASMQLSSEAAKKKGSIHIHRGYKTDPDESPETTSDGEERNHQKRFKDQAALAPTAYVNSNVQNINNSIIIETSITDRSPGVYLSFSQDTSEVTKSNGKWEFVQTRKAEFIPTTSEKLTHEPNVRRRCLRGLFMEPSDSDPDNPDKPRRHGCRYSCGESKDKEIM